MRLFRGQWPDGSYHRPTLPADFSEVPFETYIIRDNLYQSYLDTQDKELLDQLGSTLYGKEIKFKPYERVSIFYWFASLKEWIAHKYPDFFQPMEAATGGNLLRAPSMNVEAAMNAQIRALYNQLVGKRLFSARV